MMGCHEEADMAFGRRTILDTETGSEDVIDLRDMISVVHWIEVVVKMLEESNELSRIPCLSLPATFPALD